MKNRLSEHLFIIPLGLFGIMHFVFSEFFMPLVPSWAGNPYFWIYFSGLALTLSSISISLHLLHKTASFLLLLFITTFIVAVDIPGLFNEASKFYSMVSLLKDISLFGGTLTLYLTFKNE